MAWTLVQKSAAQGNGTGTLPAGTTAGNLLVAVIGNGSSTAITAPAGQGWDAGHSSVNGAVSEAYIFVSYNCPSGITSSLFSGGLGTIYVILAEFTCPGVSAVSAPSDSGTGIAGAGTTDTVTTAGTSLTGDLVVGTFLEHLSTAGTASWTDPGGFSRLGDDGGAASVSNHSVGNYRLAAAAGGVQSVTETSSNSSANAHAWSGVVLTFTQPGRPAVIQPVAQPPQPAAPPPPQVRGAPSGAIAGTVALSGSGTLTVGAVGVGEVPGVISPVVQPPQPPQPPPGRINALLQPIQFAAATLSGSGTLTVGAPGVGGPIPVLQAPPPTRQPAPQPAPQIIAFPTAAQLGAATLSGSGTLTVGAPGVGEVPGVIQAVAQPPQPPRPPPSQVVALAQPIQFAGAALSGSGTLTAAPVFAGTAALSGSGTLTGTGVIAGAFSVGALTATDKAGATQAPTDKAGSALTALTAPSGGTLTATDQRTGGPS